MARDNSIASLANLAAGQSFALTGGTIIHDDGSQSISDIIVGADGRFVVVEPFLNTDILQRLRRHQRHAGFAGLRRCAPASRQDRRAAVHAQSIRNAPGRPRGFCQVPRTAGPDDIHKRATRTVERCLSRGTTAIRSHINVDKDAGFHGIETLAGIRDGAKDRITSSSLRS